MGKPLQDIGIGMYFLKKPFSNSTSNNRQNEQIDLHEIKRLGHNKGSNQQSDKRKNKTWKN